MSRKRLSKNEVQKITSIAQRIISLVDNYDDYNDVQLQIPGNGSVGDQLSCALAALDTILQEY